MGRALLRSGSRCDHTHGGTGNGTVVLKIVAAARLSVKKDNHGFFVPSLPCDRILTEGINLGNGHSIVHCFGNEAVAYTRTRMLGKHANIAAMDALSD